MVKNRFDVVQSSNHATVLLLQSEEVSYQIVTFQPSQTILSGKWSNTEITDTHYAQA